MTTSHGHHSEDVLSRVEEGAKRSHAGELAALSLPGSAELLPPFSVITASALVFGEARVRWDADVLDQQQTTAATRFHTPC